MLGHVSVAAMAAEHKINPHYVSSLVEHLKSSGLIRYDELIADATRLIRYSAARLRDSEVGEETNSRVLLSRLANYKAVFVDEFQDVFSDFFVFWEGLYLDDIVILTKTNDTAIAMQSVLKTRYGLPSYKLSSGNQWVASRLHILKQILGVIAGESSSNVSLMAILLTLDSETGGRKRVSKLFSESINKRSPGDMMFLETYLFGELSQAKDKNLHPFSHYTRSILKVLERMAAIINQVQEERLILAETHAMRRRVCGRASRRTETQGVISTDISQSSSGHGGSTEDDSIKLNRTHGYRLDLCLKVELEAKKENYERHIKPQKKESHIYSWRKVEWIEITPNEANDLVESTISEVRHELLESYPNIAQFMSTFSVSALIQYTCISTSKIGDSKILFCVQKKLSSQAFENNTDIYTQMVYEVLN
ncbi:hypothetical protein JCM33374_g5252 [Metschnikowia sp. JCM 33374]|nr:hypothetical protein JCM33374_g5252 [Metschnikowia sp. JCM 33374]